MIEISQKMLEGLGVAGWVIGFLAGLGGFLMIIGIFGYAMMCVFGAEEEKEEDREREDQ